jgi:hypothetical protein
MAQKTATNSIKKLKIIDYSGRDFDSIRQNLLDYVKRYYADSYKDFNTAGFGSLMLDTVSYIGDVLSFYLDYQVNETFLDTATEYDNVVKIARQLGYKYNTAFSSMGEAQFYVSIPADSLGGPDERYIPLLRAGSTFTASGGQLFTLSEDVNFAATTNQIIVNQINAATGAPTHYAIKAVGRVISGRTERQVVSVGGFLKFRKVRLDNPRPTAVLSVVDSEGHRYYEVEHLSQEIVFKSIKNTNADKDSVPSIIKAIPVTRRFTVEKTIGEAYLQFGYGSELELTNESVADPSKIILNRHGRDYITQKDFDPTNITDTDKFGVGPSNTNLTITYRVNDSSDVNIGTGALNKISVPLLKFTNRQALNQGVVSSVRRSLEVSNENPIVGDVSIPTATEIKQRVYSFYAAQNRAVTIEDYKALVYGMPSSFGAVKRCSFERDFDSFKRNLNMYVITANARGYLIPTTRTIKENLKVWLSNYKMINDTIDVLDAKVVNFGINFTVVADSEVNRFEVVALATQRLKNFYLGKQFDIGEALSVGDVYKTLQRTPGVIDVLDVKLLQKQGGNYSRTSFDFDANLSNDGRQLNAETNSIFELKYPSSDVVGSVT